MRQLSLLSLANFRQFKDLQKALTSLARLFTKQEIAGTKAPPSDKDDDIKPVSPRISAKPLNHSNSQNARNCAPGFL